jgi:hypothetical protein
MANEFIIKNGFFSQGDSQITGSLNVTGGITGSFSGSLSAPGANSQIIFNNAGTLAGANNVYFRTNGRLGIGTDSPLARLGISGSSSDTLLKLDSDSSSSILFVTGSGNIGIGTNTPFSPLTVNGVISSGNNLGAGGGSTIGGELRSYQLDATTPLYLSLQTTSNGKSGLFRSNTDYILWYNLVTGDTVLNSSFAGASIKFTTQNSEKASIFSNGNFVIGTTTDPGAKLTVRGSGATSATTALRVENTNASASLVVLDDGTVGVGTATTSRTLQVNGSFRVNRTNQTFQYWDLETGEANFGRLRHISDGNNQKGLTISNTFTGVVPAGFWNFISFDVQNGEALRIDAARNIGIGTISPSSSLHISGASSAALLRVDSPASSSILFVSGSGRVGMGTSSPTASLHIVDAGNTSTNSLQINNLFRFRGDGVMVWGLSMAQGILNWDTGKVFLGGSSGNNLELYAGGSAKMFVSSSGLVGIGTTTPAYELQTVGTIAAGVGNVSNGTIRVERTGGGIGIRIQGSDGNLIGAGGVPAYQPYNYSDATHNFNVGHASLGSYNWYAGANSTITSNTFLMRLTRGGNILLGTTTDSARLLARGSGATSATTTFLLQNSTPTNLMTVLDNGQVSFTSPTIVLATSQSAFTISQSISASNIVGGQYYGVNITPTFFSTTSSQTETALRVAATFTGSAASTAGTNIIADFGATSAGSQFTVTDVTSGSIYMVNDVSGLPIIEATSDWTVNMYNFPNLVFNKTGSQVNIFGTLRVSGSFILPLSQSSTPQTGSAYWSGSLLFVYDGTRYRSSSFA